MPSSVTHSYFARDVLNKSKTNIKEIITSNLNTYILFSNGPDTFFTSTKTKYRKFGHTMHRQKTGKYFINIIEYIKNSDKEKQNELKAYLYGYITHYVLDSNIHPLVYYMTGRYIKGNKNRKKYKGKHQLMEFVIDEYMIAKRFNDKINKFKVHDFASPKVNLSTNITDMIIHCTKKTYDIKLSDKEIIKSINNHRRIYKLLRYDRFYIKKYIYNILNILTLNKIPQLKTLSYNFNYKKYLYYLNLDKKEWFHPLDNNEIHNSSFTELYLKSIEEAIKIITELDIIIDENKDTTNILSKLNKSYLTGKDLSDDRKIKYFSY